jgi:hypothetical protein
MTRERTITRHEVDLQGQHSFVADYEVGINECWQGKPFDPSKSEGWKRGWMDGESELTGGETEF